MLFEAKEVGELKRAVEACGQLNVGLYPAQYDEFIQALAEFMGGSVQSVDAFVTRVMLVGVDSDGHNVMWLVGQSIGLLTVRGPGNDRDPPAVSGWVRSVLRIRQVEIRSAQFYRDPGTDTIVEVRPTVQIHFDDVIAEVSVAGRTDEFSRNQAAAFIRCVQAALAVPDRAS